MDKIFEKENKYGHKAYRESKNNHGYRYSVKYDMSLPLIDGKINIDSHYDRRFYTSYDEVENDFAEAIVKIKDKTISFECDRQSECYSDQEQLHPRIFNFEQIVKMTILYAYLNKNLTNKVLNGKTKKELNEMPISELEKLVNRKTIIMEDVESSLKKLLSGDESKSAEEIVEKYFGKDEIDLNSMLEENIDASLEEDEKIEDKKNKIIAFKKRVSDVVGKVKNVVNLAKKPLILAINNAKTNSAIKKSNKLKIKQEKKHREELMDELE